MQRTNTTVALACLALAMAPLWAQAPAGDTVRDLAGRKGTDYVQARDSLLASGSLATESLAEFASAARWEGDRWREAAVAAALRARLLEAELAGKVDHLLGVDPAHYLLRRVPAPEVGRELAHLGMNAERESVVALVIETYSYLRDTYAYSETGEQAERAALSEGLLVALERLADPRGLSLAREVATDDGATIPDRIAAMLAIGAMAGRELAQTTGADGTTGRNGTAGVSLLVECASGPARLRHAAAQALAKIPSAESLAALRKLFTDETDAEVRATVLTSIGLFAAPMVWRSYGEALAARGSELRAEAARFLASQFVAARSETDRAAARDATLMARHRAALGQLDAAVAEQAVLIDALNAALARGW